ncbi:MAG: hypothetical protein HWN68_20080 [Desulfobacterales bacterium]|nr:hypothetical protein [Desulfobacterales bacterium]
MPKTKKNRLQIIELIETARLEPYVCQEVGWQLLNYAKLAGIETFGELVMKIIEKGNQNAKSKEE